MRFYKISSDNYIIEDITRNEYQLLMNAIATSIGSLEMNVDAFSKNNIKQLQIMLNDLIDNE